KELGDFTQGHYKIDSQSKNINKAAFKLTRSGKISSSPVKIIKRIALNGNDLTFAYRIKNESSDYLRNLFGVEFNLSVFDNQLSKGQAGLEADSIKVNDLWSGISLEFNLNLSASIWHFPIETVSDSDTGIEKTYQELCLVFNWPLDIAPQGEKLIRLNLRVGTSFND
ncbi:MAG: alpha-amylase/4-alpha-glucanotransferase domain-containing protein, partial [Candidatus Omnitrophota bacterium]